MKQLLVYDDGAHHERLGVSLAPLTDLKASFDIRTGARTTLERIDSLVRDRPVSGLLVPGRLERLTAERHAAPVNKPALETALYVNGRWAAPIPEAMDLAEGSALVDAEGGVLAACCDPDLVDGMLAGDTKELQTTRIDGTRMLRRPWSVRAFRDEAIRHDLAVMLMERGLDERAEVVIDDTANVHATAVLEGDDGPILIDESATVRPGAVITGPAYIGPHATVMDCAVIRANTVVGPWCKVGGEVSGTIFQSYSNKAHDGFLGDSFVGEWVNLGAGTTNSNLLNTYGEVVAVAAPGARMERTGETFLGCVLGDHVKTAICTRIMTGAVVHTGAMWASATAVTGCVEPFAWVTDERRQRYRMERFLEAARAMMARRGIEPSGAYIAALESVFSADSL